MSYDGRKYSKSSSLRPASGRTNKALSQPVEKNQRAKSNLLEREEEYKRLNAELEAKTAELVREAEAMMTEQENFLMKSSPHKSSDSEVCMEDTPKESVKMKGSQSVSLGAKFGLLDLVDSDEYAAGEAENSASARLSSRTTGSFASMNRKGVSAGSNRRPNSSLKANRVTKSRSSAKSSRKVLSVADDVAIPDDFVSKLTLDGAISDIEKNLGDNFSAREPTDDDIMPDAAAEMGSEAQIRFLKAKLRVMQEELEHLSQECRSGMEERRKLNESLKDASEEQARLQKMNNAQQVQIEKHKRLFEDEKKKSDSVGMQVQKLRKELDALRREQKQSSVMHNATEVRLNRALEDVEKYKTQLQKDKHSSKETAMLERREMDRLRTDNKRLERLKSDMSTVFKKQQKLISILKRQILHIEAAKLLSFTEEEFLRALDWGTK